jgi:hypothetical protein
MRVVVTGGRDYADRERVYATLDALGVRMVAHGGARGADWLADDWAESRGVTQAIFEAHWDRDGKAAGPRRNIRMLHDFHPDAVVAFPGGRGTAHCVAEARKRGIRVIEVAP